MKTKMKSQHKILQVQFLSLFTEKKFQFQQFEKKITENVCNRNKKEKRKFSNLSEKKQTQNSKVSTDFFNRNFKILKIKRRYF